MSSPDSVSFLRELSRTLRQPINTAVLLSEHDIAHVHTTIAYDAEDVQSLLRDLADAMFPEKCHHERCIAEADDICDVCGSTDFGTVPMAVPDASEEPSTDENEGRADESA
jgi:hypothetical protein